MAEEATDTKDRSYMTSVITSGFDDNSEGMTEFRVVTRAKGLTFRSETIDREYVHKKLRNDPFWITRFEGVRGIEGRAEGGDWVEF